MSSEKRLTLKRILIFIAFSFLPLIVAVPILEQALGGRLYEGENASHPAVFLMGFFGMLMPTAANLLTRLITGEGLKDHYLRLNMRGNVKYYLLALLVPVVYCAADAAIILLRYGEGGALLTDEPLLGGCVIISQLTSIIYMLLPYFGEEFGWRAYLTPKLTELLPEPLAVLISGIIWGLWHAPLTISGHNFGVDYPLYPFTGIGYMCLFCVCIGAFLTVLTKRTGSVFPAAIAHGTNNALAGGVFMAAVLSEEVSAKIAELDSFTYMVMLLPPVLAVGIVSYLILIADYIKAKKAAAK